MNFSPKKSYPLSKYWLQSNLELVTKKRQKYRLNALKWAFFIKKRVVSEKKLVKSNKITIIYTIKMIFIIMFRYLRLRRQKIVNDLYVYDGYEGFIE